MGIESKVEAWQRKAACLECHRYILQGSLYVLDIYIAAHLTGSIPFHLAIALPTQSIAHEKDANAPTTKRRLTFDDLVLHTKHYNPVTRKGKENLDLHFRRTT